MELPSATLSVRFLNALLIDTVFKAGQEVGNNFITKWVAQQVYRRISIKPQRGCCDPPLRYLMGTDYFFGTSENVQKIPDACALVPALNIFRVMCRSP